MPLHNQNTDFLDRSNTYPKYRFYSKIGTLHHFGWGWVVGYREMPSPLLTHIHTHNVKKNGVNDTVCLVVHKKSYMQKCTSIKKMHGCIIIRVIELFFDLFCTFCTYDFFYSNSCRSKTISNICYFKISVFPIVFTNMSQMVLNNNSQLLK